MPHRAFPSCNKGEHGHKCLIENSRFVTKVIFADKDKSRSCSEKTPWTRKKDSPEVTLEDKDRSQNTPWMLEKDSPGGSGYETIHDCRSIVSNTHTHPRFIEFSGNFRRGSSRQIVNVPGGLCKAVYVCTFHNCDTTLPQSKKRRNKM